MVHSISSPGPAERRPGGGEAHRGSSGRWGECTAPRPAAHLPSAAAGRTLSSRHLSALVPGAGMFARRDYIRDYMMIPPGTGEAAVVNVIVEIPKGRRNKFEVDKVTGLIKLDRYLYSSAVYPGDYGFIPQTLAEDHDPLDALVMVNEPTFSGCLIEARVVGIFRMRDKGQNDFKILGVPRSEEHTSELQ